MHVAQLTHQPDGEWKSIYGLSTATTSHSICWQPLLAYTLPNQPLLSHISPTANTVQLVACLQHNIPTTNVLRPSAHVASAPDHQPTHSVPHGAATDW
jgi:hypothetical protein